MNHGSGIFRRMTIILGGLLLLTGFFCQIASARAKAESSIIIHVIDVKPYGYMDANGKAAGIHYDIIGELQKRSGLAIERRLLPYPRIWKGLENGTHDGGIVWRSSDRDAFVDYVAFVFTDYITVLGLKEGKPLRQYEDLYDIGTVGIMRDLSVSDKFNQDLRINKQIIATMEQSLLMLDKGRINAVVGAVNSYIYLTSHLPLKHKLDFPGLIMGYKEQWFQMAKHSDKLKYKDKIKEAIDSMNADGFIESVYQKYLGHTYQKIKTRLHY